MRKIKIETPEMEPLAISQEQAKARYNMGTYMIDKVAGDAKAIVRIGRRKVYLVGNLMTISISWQNDIGALTQLLWLGGQKRSR